MIPFSPPRLDEETADAVREVLLSGWITTGPKTKLFEQKLADYCRCEKVLCLNSATSAMEVMLRWFGIGPGDEVIVPAYTYCATANVVVHTGATVVMCDINESDFTIDLSKIASLITDKTKAIIPVDIGGMPADYSSIMKLVNDSEIRKQFNSCTDEQSKLGRILVMGDCAHSFGSTINNKKTGSQCDAMVFSFHAVKNLTTGEGGAICFNFPDPFSNKVIYDELNVFTLHGQTKSALDKLQPGSWKYDVTSAGYKCNMMDIQAAIGLVELSRYDTETLPARKRIAEKYSSAFGKEKWARIPVMENNGSLSCAHLYMLRIPEISEEQRNQIIQLITEKGVSVNVHFIPLPMLTFYNQLGFDIEKYPVSYLSYSTEISLPLYYNLTDEQVDKVIDVVRQSVNEVIR